MTVTDIQIQGYVPGAIGRIAELHGVYYHQHWQFGLFFEARVASELAAFLNRFESERDGFWTVSLEGRVEGGITIDGIDAQTKGAHLRWFVLSDRLRGQGVGNQLMELAVAFCIKCKYASVYLETFAGLDAARHLYEKFGFVLMEEWVGEQWGTRVNEQRFVLRF
jgi:GNAT superfamily N-acetyltransferase